MKFLLSVIDTATRTGTDGEMAAVSALNDELIAAGQLIAAEGLAHPDDSVVIDARGDDISLTAGPFATGREYLSGFWLIEAPSAEVARDIATRASRACARRVELRATLG